MMLTNIVVSVLNFGYCGMRLKVPVGGEPGRLLNEQQVAYTCRAFGAARTWTDVPLDFLASRASSKCSRLREVLSTLSKKVSRPLVTSLPDYSADASQPAGAELETVVGALGDVLVDLEEEPSFAPKLRTGPRHSPFLPPPADTHVVARLEQEPDMLGYLPFVARRLVKKD